MPAHENSLHCHSIVVVTGMSSLESYEKLRVGYTPYREGEADGWFAYARRFCFE
jgi:hypothetical protein